MTATEIGNWFVRSLPEAILLCWLVTAILGIQQKKSTVIGYGTIASIIYVAIPMILPVELGGFIMVVSCSIYLAYGLLVCKAPVVKAIKAAIVTPFAVLSCDIFSMLIMQNILGISQEVIVGRSVPIMAMSTLGLVLMFVYIKIARKINAKKTSSLPASEDAEVAAEDVWE